MKDDALGAKQLRIVVGGRPHVVGRRRKMHLEASFPRGARNRQTVRDEEIGLVDDEQETASAPRGRLDPSGHALVMLGRLEHAFRPSLIPLAGNSEKATGACSSSFRAQRPLGGQRRAP